MVHLPKIRIVIKIYIITISMVSVIIFHNITKLESMQGNKDKNEDKGMVTPNIMLMLSC